MKTIFRTLLILLLSVISTQAWSQDPEGQGKKAGKTEKRAKKKKEAEANAVPMIEFRVPVPVLEPEEADSVPVTTIAFAHDTYDFGKIKAGEVIKHEFQFTNTGKNPLIIENVKPSCGCTATEYSKEPVPPGESGTITAMFNSAGKVGQQLKYITIVFNGDPKITRIAFTGEILQETPPSPSGN